jgi:hypothetical protein
MVLNPAGRRDPEATNREAGRGLVDNWDALRKPVELEGRCALAVNHPGGGMQLCFFT